MKVFISYRRDADSFLAHSIQRELQQVLGHSADVFMDTTSMRPGADVPESIKQSIAACDVVVVVIGRTWDDGRLHAEDDWVRIELQLAHELDKEIVPIAHGTTPQRDVRSLPPELAWFSQLLAFPVAEGKDPGEEVRQFVARLTAGQTSAPLAGVRIGLSFSVPETDEEMKSPLPPIELNGAAAYLVDKLLESGATLAYGGLAAYERPPANKFDNFNQLVHFAARNHYSGSAPRVITYIQPDTRTVSSEARGEAITYIATTMPEDAPNVSGPVRSAIQLTAVRRAMAQHVHAQIFLCGRQLGYSGRMPGLLEEAVLTRKESKPLYFLGAFGGMTADLVQLAQTGQSTSVDLLFQLSHARPGYPDLYEELSETPYSVNYRRIRRLFGSEEAFTENGLTEAENLELMTTDDADRALELIKLGLGACAATN